MDIPKSCGNCPEKQLGNLEAAGERRTILCPLLAILALKSEYRTPLIERHFLNLSAECATETQCTGGLYKIQQVQGALAVEAAAVIRSELLPNEQGGVGPEQITVLNTGERLPDEFAA